MNPFHAAVTSAAVPTVILTFAFAEPFHKEWGKTIKLLLNSKKHIHLNQVQPCLEQVIRSASELYQVDQLVNKELRQSPALFSN